MLLNIFKLKIHRATVTEANLNYEGSLTVDATLMEAANMIEYEKIHVVNMNTGARLETYLIKGQPGSGTICLNGAAARLGAAGDKIIVITYGQMTPDEAKTHKPKAVLVNDKNQIVKITPE